MSGARDGRSLCAAEVEQTATAQADRMKLNITLMGRFFSVLIKKTCLLEFHSVDSVLDEIAQIPQQIFTVNLKKSGQKKLRCQRTVQQHAADLPTMLGGPACEDLSLQFDANLLQVETVFVSQQKR